MLRYSLFLGLLVILLSVGHAQRQWVHSLSAAFVKPAPMAKPSRELLRMPRYYEQTFEQRYAPSLALGYQLSRVLTPTSSIILEVDYVLEQQYFRNTRLTGLGTSIQQYLEASSLFRSHHLAPKIGFRQGIFNHPRYQLFIGLAVGYNMQLGADEHYRQRVAYTDNAPFEYTVHHHSYSRKLSEYQRRAGQPNGKFSQLTEGKFGVAFQSHRLAFVVSHLWTSKNRADYYLLYCEDCFPNDLPLVPPLNENMFKTRMDWWIQYQYDF